MEKKKEHRKKNVSQRAKVHWLAFLTVTNIDAQFGNWIVISWFRQPQVSLTMMAVTRCPVRSENPRAVRRCFGNGCIVSVWNYLDTSERLESMVWIESRARTLVWLTSELDSDEGAIRQRPVRAYGALRIPHRYLRVCTNMLLCRLWRALCLWPLLLQRTETYDIPGQDLENGYELAWKSTSTAVLTDGARCIWLASYRALQAIVCWVLAGLAKSLMLIKAELSLLQVLSVKRLNLKHYNFFLKVIEIATWLILPVAYACLKD